MKNTVLGFNIGSKGKQGSLLANDQPDRMQKKYGAIKGPVHLHKDGAISELCFLKNGVFHGERKTWDVNGKVDIHVMYDRGMPILNYPSVEEAKETHLPLLETHPEYKGMLNEK